jgi:AcrR family transcriptional regulator
VSRSRATALPPDERRALILDAAEPLLRQHGRNVSTRQIAQAAGVAEGTLFRVFDNKEDLINNTVARSFSAEPTVELLDQIDPGLPLEERMVEITTLLRNRLNETFALLHALGPPPEATSEDRQAFVDFMRTQNELITNAVVGLIKSDESAMVVSPAQAAYLLTSIIMVTSNPMLVRVREMAHLSSEPEALVDLVLHGCLVESTRTKPGFDHQAVEPQPTDYECTTRNTQEGR